MPFKSLTSQQIVWIHQLFRQAKFDDPSGGCLSPAGEYNLRLGIIKELHPDMVATYSGSWNSYKINQTQDKIGVFVSTVSTEIPFKGTGKVYIGDDISKIASAVKIAIKQCCAQLKSKIVKRIQAHEQQERKRSLSKYILNATGATYEILKEMSSSCTSKKKRPEDKDAELLKQVSAKLVTEETLREKLTQHVEQVDYEMALEYATQTG